MEDTVSTPPILSLKRTRDAEDIGASLKPINRVKIGAVEVEDVTEDIPSSNAESSSTAASSSRSAVQYLTTEEQRTENPRKEKIARKKKFEQKPNLAPNSPKRKQTPP